MSRKTREDARRPLSDASLLQVAEAVREIGGRETTVYQWLRDNNLIRTVPGLGKRVSWRQVLALVEVGQGPSEPVPTRPAGRLPRTPL